MKEISRIIQSTESKSGQCIWKIQSDEGDISYEYGDTHKPFFIASATKLYVTAILAQLREEQKISWDDPVLKYLPHLNLEGLVRDKFSDLTPQITIQEVMAHTAGLPDYFEGKRGDGTTIFKRIIKEDFAWTFDDVVTWTKEMKPTQRGKSLYSDTGYQLLGVLIESVDQKSFSDSLETRIVKPLKLMNTFCFGSEYKDCYDQIANIKYGNEPLLIPKAMSSVQADGGIVSSASDAMVFLDAFFDGQLFTRSLLGEIQTNWHRIFAPFEYGTGIMRFRLPRIFTGFRQVPAAVGHGGATGTVIFRVPDLGINIVGTTNQLKNRPLAYRTLVKIIMELM